MPPKSRQPTPLQGVPVLMVPIESSPIRRSDEQAEPAKRLTWKSVTAAIGGSVTLIVGVAWTASALFAARPTHAEVRDQINSSPAIIEKASKHEVDAEFKLLTAKQADQEKRISVSEAKIDWIVDTLGLIAVRQGVKPPPAPKDE